MAQVVKGFAGAGVFGLAALYFGSKSVFTGIASSFLSLPFSSRSWSQGPYFQ